MAFYMFLLMFAMILFLINARPFYQTWPEMEDYNNMIDYDRNDRYIHEEESRERRPRTMTRVPDLFFWKFQEYVENI